MRAYGVKQVQSEKKVDCCQCKQIHRTGHITIFNPYVRIVYWATLQVLYCRMCLTWITSTDAWTPCWRPSPSPFSITPWLSKQTHSGKWWLIFYCKFSRNITDKFLWTLFFYPLRATLFRYRKDRGRRGCIPTPPLRFLWKLVGRMLYMYICYH